MFKFVFVALALSLSAQAEPLKKKDLSPSVSQAIQAHQDAINSRKVPFETQTRVPERPFSEIENAGYLFFSADANFNSREAKRIMAKNLPEGVTLVIYGDSFIDKETVMRTYADVISPERVKVIQLRGASRGFWTRDGMPVPVWSKQGTLDLVDARYYHGFEPDEAISQMFGSHLYRHSYYFEGGNFMVNDAGDCLSINNKEAVRIPEDVFRNLYGCKRVIRVPHIKGIGHMDESVRFVGRNTVVTDTPQYVSALREAGFEVLELPRPNRTYETYVNALLVNGTIYVPVFGQENDERALDVYRKVGLNVVPIETVSLANDGLGSIHCITMTYPNVPFQALLKALGAKEL